MSTLDHEAIAVGELPLTESQKGLVAIDRMSNAGHLYTLVCEIHLTSAPPPGDVLAALEGTVLAQPGLRQAFSPWPAPYAVLKEPVPTEKFPFAAGQLSGTEGIREAVARLGATQFDLDNGPLYRFEYLSSDTSAVLVFAAHHLVFDYFSLQPFLDDFIQFLSERPSRDVIVRRAERRSQGLVQELAIQKRIAEENSTLQAAEQLAEPLRGTPATAVNPVPGRPTETAFVGARIEWELAETETAAVRSACRNLGLTPYEFFMAAYSAVLARHTACTDVIVGSPFFNRRTAGSLDQVGFYVNTLPLVLRTDWSAGFADYAQSVVKPAIAFAQSRSHVAFNQLVEVLRPDRFTNRNPVFSCMLALYEDLLLPSAVSAVHIRGNDTAKFDLWLGITTVEDRLRFELEHDIALIPPAVAEGIVHSLRSAVQRAVSTPEAGLADLFTDASLAESRDADGFRAPAPSDSLAEWQRLTALANTARTAIEDGGQSISYGALEEAIAATAAALRRRGIRPGHVVGLQLDGLVATVTAMLAVMRAGATYLPLDPALPAGRIAHMTAKSGCALIIGAQAPEGVDSVLLEELTADGRADGGTVPEKVRGATYVMFTSGSSGLPKGVEMAEGALHNLTGWQIAALDMGPDTRFVQYAPLGFDVSFQEIVPTLCSGGTLIGRGTASRHDFPALMQRVRDAEATHVYLPVAALRPFALAVLDGGIRLTSLTHVCVSGEQLALDEDIRRFFEVHPDCVLVNLYGPTETHAVTTRRLEGTPAAWPAHVPIGRPLTGVSAYVVDAAGRLAPPGVQGELFLGGRCPALGYVNDAETSARVFLPDTFTGSGTMYRTGDQVLRDHTGDLIFLGRNDDQTKIRGYRVELGEIEYEAKAAEGVRDAAACVRETAGNRELVLFAVADEQFRDQLSQRLAVSLPAYAVPKHVIVVDRLLTTSNGKVDRAGLIRRAENDGAFEPRVATDAEPVYASSVERELAELWAGLLKVAAVERETSLLAYGAHSLMMFQAIRLIRKQFGVTISVMDLFGAPTIAAIAQKIAPASTDMSESRT